MSGDPKRAVRLQCRGVGTVRLPWWPEDIEFSRLAANWEQVERRGRVPVLARRSMNLPEVRIGGVMSTANAEGPGNVQRQLVKLQAMARSRNPVTLNLASRAGRYRITDLGITELDWDGGGRPTNAEVSIVLTRVSDAALPVGPVKRR